MSLTINTAHLAVLRYIVRTALYSAPEIRPVTWVVPSSEVRTTTTSDFASLALHKADELKVTMCSDTRRKRYGGSRPDSPAAISATNGCNMAYVVEKIHLELMQNLRDEAWR